MSSPETDLPIGVQWANFYRNHKLQVIPAIAGQKRPGLEAWEDLQNDLASQAVFDRWFGPYGSRQNTTALGVIPIRGQFVVDLDVKPGRDGLTRWQEFIETHLNGIDPETWESVTGGGGRHKWFQAPDGWIPPTVKFPAIGWDVRGQGGYVVVPPTLHASGQHYTWAEGRRPDECDLAMAPPELLAEIERLRALGSGPGPGRDHVNAGPGAVYTPLGLKIDGREQDLADTAWAILVDRYRELLRTSGDVIGPPTPETLREDIDLAYQRFLTRVKVRADDPPGASDEERLDRAGRGRKDLVAKVVKALRKWHTKVREDAMRGDPDDPGPGSRPDVDSDFNFGPSAKEEPRTPRPAFGRPFVGRDRATLPKREWVYRPAYPRGYLSLSIGAGGVGKSAQLIAEAVMLAAGRNLFSRAEPLIEPARVLYLNLEDPLIEIERRIAAVMKRYKITETMLAGRLHYGSGRDRDLIIARLDRHGEPCAGPDVGDLLTEMLDLKIDLLTLDPFINSHAMSENDNMAMAFVAKTLGEIADLTKAAVHLSHHIRKSNGEEVTTDHARGASALVSAARYVRTIQPMTADEARRLGIEPDQGSSYIRLDNGKSNLTPLAKTSWVHLDSELLENGDVLQVPVRWSPPDFWDGVSAEDLTKVQAVIDRGRLPAPVGWRDKPTGRDHHRFGWKANPRAGDAWAGHAVGEACSFDSKSSSGMAKASALLAAWVKSEALVEVRHKDQNGRVAPYIEVGSPPEP